LQKKKKKKKKPCEKTNYADGWYSHSLLLLLLKEVRTEICLSPFKKKTEHFILFFGRTRRAMQCSSTQNPCKSVQKDKH
jgi:hypothetical protein